MTWRMLVAVIFLLSGIRSSVADDDRRPSSIDVPWIGTTAPDTGDLVVTFGGGASVLFPHAELAARLGTGQGTRLEVIYRNYAVFGQEGEVRIGWGRRMGCCLATGARLRSSITSLALADGLFGVGFSSLSPGNDWKLGGDVLMSWIRPGQAHVTFELGTTWTLGGVHYITYDDREFRIEPAWRSLNVAIQGEWRSSARRHVFVRLHGSVFLQGDVMPIGFLPTSTVGLAWSFQ